MPLAVDAFGTVKRENSRRISEVRAFWSGAKTLEVQPPGQQSFLYLANCGMTIVYSYGALEYCMTRCVQQLAELITKYEVRVCDIAQNLMCLVHDPQFAAAIAAGKSTRIEKRLELFNGVHSRRFAKIHIGLLSSDMQNIWFTSIKNIFSVFGINADPISSLSYSTKIDHLVNDRNSISHGRESPEIVGSKYTSTDIDAMLDWIASETQHIIVSFEQYYYDRHFISQTHRSRYRRKDA